MNFVIVAVSGLLIGGYTYLLTSGLRLRRRLKSLKKSSQPNLKQHVVVLPGKNFVEDVYQLTTLENNPDLPSLPTPAITLPPMETTLSKLITDKFIDHLSLYVTQFNLKNKKSIELTIIKGQCNLSFKDSLLLLTSVHSLVSNSSHNEAWQTSLFVLATTPFQLSMTTSGMRVNESSIYSLVVEEIQQSSSLEIISHETTHSGERLVIGVNETKDEDSNSRRSRNFQRKY
ncbi:MULTISPECIES: hypothetical protein [unclassified Imperialibacter]|uniref:hypothetical protein n=1 Tax=unclassified Imperialibacter TaxID=2629706 RepID=UPI0012519C18|nr:MULTISPECIES: hypothetical protein [unclassified Imperialibacter]CAD5268747.1 hypothetical protein IMPERIA75_350041 [Imperialibacter sp. 75]CAD5299952.1 hypothetical protein IMPERIA89_90041 [Imperialibacter sp. 89]VVT21900.1 hypothetical protein IMPR6_340041 [Imperialibacter sp. EC-SDR9]